MICKQSSNKIKLNDLELLDIKFCILGLILVIGFSIFLGPSFADTQVIIPLGAANTNTPFSLSPSVIDVKTNETVTWQNNDVSIHTVTTGTTSLGFDGRIDSGVIATGESFSYKFNKAGVYGYYCLFHPWMTGVVNVGSNNAKVQPVDTISFSTDKSSYHNGDSILISGKVSNFIPNEQVTVWITNLHGVAVAISHVETESSDDFSTSIPSGGGLWESGNTYKVYAQYGSRSSIASTDIVFEPQNYTKVNVSQITLAPLKQIKSGVSVDNVQCSIDLVLVIKTEDGSPACVKSDTATKLSARGWSQSTSGSDQTSNQIVTLEQNNQEISLKKGERFLLKLGNNYNWNIDIADQTIVSRVINIMVINGAQGIYEAHNAGTTTLTAQGDPFCLSLIPRCAMPSLLFKVNIVVT